MLDNLKVRLRNYPRLYGILRNASGTWQHVVPPNPRAGYRQLISEIQAIEHQVQQIEAGREESDSAPVLFFNATSGPNVVSFNALAGLMISWSLRIAGQKVLYLLCREGMPMCVQGTNMHDTGQPMPCKQCFPLRNEIYPAHLSRYIEPDPQAREALPAADQCSIQDMAGFTYQGIELGRLCMPSVVWVLRQQQLELYPEAKKLLHEFLVSAVGIVNSFQRLAAQTKLKSVVVFNGTVFPEATIRTLAVKRGLPAVTYECGFNPNSVFLSHDIATKYTLSLPEDFRMDASQEAYIDNYMAKRVQGDFTIGGSSVWPKMLNISTELSDKAAAHRQVVSIFTNVIFDTSQAHAGTVFEHMFAWLDATMKLVAANPDTLFVVRAHPHELRPGKETRETVQQWLETRGYLNLPNLAFISPSELISSYELIRLSRFCIVYNSTVGMEAVLLGTPVIASAQSKYSEAAFTHAPATPKAYREMVTSFLKEGAPSLPEEWQQRARNLTYYMLFRASLDLSAFLESPPRRLKFSDALSLSPENSPEMKIIYDGITTGKPFGYP